MAIIKKTEIILDSQYDPKRCRQLLNGKTYVLHCHHFSTLYTQLADDCGMLDGRQLLSDVAEDAFFAELSEYYRAHGIQTASERLEIATQYFAVTGLGKVSFDCAGSESGEVSISHSHVDEGWIKKWGRRDRPVNFIGCGFIAAAFAAAFDKTPRSFRVTETQSIVSGAAQSLFNVVAN